MNRVLDFALKTEANYIHGLLPFNISFNHELDMILQYDMNQPSFNFRACYEMEKTSSVYQTIENFAQIEVIECPFSEKVEHPIEKKMNIIKFHHLLNHLLL